MGASSDDLYLLIGDVLPNDHARQVSAAYLAELVIRDRPAPRVLDLGCGDGRSIDVIRRIDPSAEWHGLDLESSPEVATRTRTDGTFHSYDGSHIPFDDATFDIVYSVQVFEHVRHPEQVLREIGRILRPGGAFVGSVSSLEPYHSFSLWNYTPYGWYTLLKDAGLTPRQFRPGIDGVALIRRQYLGRPPEANGWWDVSPLNAEMDTWGKETGRRAALINLRKVLFCGHLVFWAEKVAG